MRGKKAHKASGGPVWYAGGGSKTAKESEDKTDDFKRGGKASVKVSGHKGHKRLDKRARGGAVGKSLSSTARLSQPEKGAPKGNDESPSAADEGD